MVDEMFDGGQMDIAEAEDVVGAMAAGQQQGGQAGQQLAGQQQQLAGQQPNMVANLLNELNYSERTVHADFRKDFGELYDDKDLN